MAKQTIGIGTSANDGTGDTIRTAFNKTNENFTEVYKFTGWISRFNASTVSLSAATNNLITITGTPESNNGLTLLDANSRITPITLNDVITVDFACTFITPSGSDHYATISLFVPGGGFYRSFTHVLIKGSGNDDEFSVSWVLPVGSQFLAEGGDIVIVPDVACSIKNKYIAVTRTHVGQ
jgi:hypothetical protein